MLLAQYRGLVCWDFEYRPDVNGRPTPVCASFLEMRSGARVQWREGEFRKGPPFSTGHDMLWVSYHASAETNCHRVLGWGIPQNTLDLEAEFRLATTGEEIEGGKNLVNCAVRHGLVGLDLAEKKSMRDLILGGGPYTAEDWAAILAYNWIDADALAALVPLMVPAILERPHGWAFALLRGYYSAHVVSDIENRGILLDIGNWRRIEEHRLALRAALIDHCNRRFDLYVKGSWNNHKFVNFLVREDIPWPTYEDGRPILLDDTFSEMSDIYGELYPQIAEVRQFRQTLAQLRKSKLFVGADGRNRYMLGQFVAGTSRNAPNAGKYIFGQPSYMRHLVVAEHGRALAYIDWDSQEFAIAGALSGDENMLTAAATGDPHMAFAILAGNAPKGAAKGTHPEVRRTHKACNLGVLFGMGEMLLAAQIRKSRVEAHQLLEHHRRVFPRYWAWSRRAVTDGTLFGYYDLTFGWRVHDGPMTKVPSLMNAPMQGNAAECMRIAACLAYQANVQISTILHDAFLIEADLAHIDDAVATMRRCMDEASRIVLAGTVVSTSVKLVLPGQRYVDEDRPAAIHMWDRVLRQLDAIERGSSSSMTSKTANESSWVTIRSH